MISLRNNFANQVFYADVAHFNLVAFAAIGADGDFGFKAVFAALAVEFPFDDIEFLAAPVAGGILLIAVKTLINLFPGMKEEVAGFRPIHKFLAVVAGDTGADDDHNERKISGNL